jgi:virulence factor Mce-like protein
MLVPHLKAKLATLVAFAAICGLIFVYLFHAAGGRLGFSSPYTVSAIMPTTFNLVPNSDVRAAGVQVGYVDSVTPDGANSRVTFSITARNSSFPPLYKNATVQVRTKTLVGETYLSITPGTPAAGQLANGDTLPATRALEAVPLQKVLGMLDPATRASVRQSLRGLGVGLNGHGTQLNDLFGSLQPAVDNGNRLFETLNPERSEVASLIDDSGQVMQALGERTAQFQQLVVDAKSTAEAVASRAAQLRATFADLPSTLAQARVTVAALGRFSSRATPVFSNLRAASTQLSPAIEQLAPTAAESRVLFRELRPFLVAVQPLVSALRPAASKLRTVVLPLDALLRQADPALAYLTAYSREFGSFFSNVNAVTDTKDGLGYRGRVYAIVGAQQFTDLTPAEQNLLNALEKAGTFGLLSGTRSNPYPQPGTAGSPDAATNYKVIKAAP